MPVERGKRHSKIRVRQLGSGVEGDSCGKLAAASDGRFRREKTIPRLL